MEQTHEHEHEYDVESQTSKAELREQLTRLLKQSGVEAHRGKMLR